MGGNAAELTASLTPEGRVITKGGLNYVNIEELPDIWTSPGQGFRIPQ